MRFLTLYWWEWVAYLFGFSSIIINGLWLLITFKKKPMLSGNRALTPTSQNSRESTALPAMQPQGKKTVWIASSMTLLLGIAAGYGVRDWQIKKVEAARSEQLYQRTVTRTNFFVVRVDGNGKFCMAWNNQPDPKHKCWEAKFSPERIPPFDEGMVIDQLTYEDMGEYWSISLSNSKLGFLIHRDEHGNIIRRGV